MQRIGERIRRHRENQLIQLNILSEKVGVTASCLSQIEKGKAFPSIITLKKIAENLHTTVGELIGENETLSINPVVKKPDKKFVKSNSNDTRLYLLSHHDANKLMEVYLIHFEKESDTSEIMIKHPGQEFCHIISGVIEFSLDSIKYILKKGDNIYFNSNMQHSAKNINKNSSEMLWIVTPPNI
jgi:transcriptional regulator with XRE-family HTH domain